MNSNQRRFQRRSLQVDFQGRDAQGAGLLLFKTADLSQGGSFLKSDLLLEVGETLSVEFQVPGLPRLLRAQARVVWVRRFPKSTEPPGMGVEFLSMSEEDRKALGDYLGT